MLRPPLPDEGPALTELCLRSKAVHGYEAAFMDACRDELTVDPAKPTSRIMVAEIDGVRAGIAEILFTGNEAELDKLFVEPVSQGKGVGKVLLDWAKSEAVKHGVGALVFDADPGASDFYEKQGAILESRSPSGSIPGRFLPRYRLPLRGASA